MKRPKIIVSACLLGEACRYDGCSKQNDAVLKAVDGMEVIAFCPEAPVMGTPRGPINIVATEDHGLRVRKAKDGMDVTDLLIEQTEQIIKAHSDVRRIILKARSPSCGIGTTPVLDEIGNEIGKGNGVAADLLLRAFREIEVIDEEML